MLVFSKEIRNFLLRADKDMYDDLAMVPKSDSCAAPGDFVIFRYALGEGVGSRAQRLAMVVMPVIKDPTTGNLLLTALKMDAAEEFSSQDLENLYTSRLSLPINSYRTYRMNRIYGPLFRLPRKEHKGQDAEKISNAFLSRLFKEKS